MKHVVVRRILACLAAVAFFAAARLGVEVALGLNGWKYYVVVGLAAWVGADGIRPMQIAIFGNERSAEEEANRG